MIKGIETFRKYFEEYSDQYVLIGGAACDLIFTDIGGDFRATKDFDIVLIMEALTPSFGKRFWDFIQEGEYKNRTKSNGSPQFFRFEKPNKSNYPFMIELFARNDSTFIDYGQVCRPIHIDDELSSLSAILLDDEYYKLLSEGKMIIDGIPLLSALYLVPFKAKAWLDLKQKKEQGHHVNERDLKKHKNDIIRLSTLFAQTDKCPLPAAIKQDMAKFIEELELNPVNPKDLKIQGITTEDIISLLTHIYE